MNYLICSKQDLMNHANQDVLYCRFVHIRSFLDLSECLIDSILEANLIDETVFKRVPSSVHLVLFRPGVTDNTAHVIEEVVRIKFNQRVMAHSGFALVGLNHQKKHIQTELKKHGYNKLIHNLYEMPFEKLKEFQISLSNQEHVVESDVNLNPVVAIEQSLESLLELSQKSHWGFNFAELKLIQSYFLSEGTIRIRSERGLDLNPTWIEMECLAQSWSEHCKHKIFASHIEYQETITEGKKRLGNKIINGIFKTFIKKLTDELKPKKEWLISVFHDNAGVVRFSPHVDLCIKVETHNSPSALDPFGGAMTGVLGVQRDIMGTGLGAEPIANLDVFCLARPDSDFMLPKGLHHPQYILDGVHKGVQAAGNKMGIPTVNGSFVFDDQYAGKPLVYCGTVGVLPPQIQGCNSSEKRAKPGDLIMVAGGRVGKDGIHGATLSSREMNDSTPSSMVQLGDPFTQKRVLDFLLQARRTMLFSSVTDNGAGGLSSSVGEMATATNGARLYLDRVPLKYSGLSPYEILISESQERMTFAVPKENRAAILDLANDFEVELADLGEFTDHGFLDFFYKNNLIGSLELKFLHGGLPPTQYKAEFFDSMLSAKTAWVPRAESRFMPADDLSSFGEVLKRVLSDWNVRSKKSRVEQYDQQVKGASLLRPYSGRNARSPQCAAVLALFPYGGTQNEAVALGHGLAPHISRWDTYTSAQWALDECVRNLICVGANPDKIAILDNFSWPDPIVSKTNLDGSQKLSELVRAGQGLYDLAKHYETPFVSGKDSMKNDFIGELPNGSQVKISALPTVLVSGIGYVSDISLVKGSHFKGQDELLYLINWDSKAVGLGESVMSRYTKIDDDSQFVHEVKASQNWNTYRLIHQALRKNLLRSVCDVSEGGIITTILESLFGSPKLGCTIKWNHSWVSLFSEKPGTLVVSVEPHLKNPFEEHFLSVPIYDIGELNLTGKIEVHFKNESKCFQAAVEELEAVWEMSW